MSKESCGSPQGTVSSPWLFLIYMEAMLRHIVPIATRHDIQVGCSLMILQRGRQDIAYTDWKSTLLGSPGSWTKPHNMQLSKKKGKCSTLLFTNNRQDPLPNVQLDGKTLLAVKKFKLLGVILDAQLTMKPHFEKLVKESKMRLKQLCAVANSCFGPFQLSLRNMYVAYIRSVFDYAAPVWYPLMSKTNLNKLQRLQNKTLREILGLPLSTRIQDLHLECNIEPLEVCYQVATAYQAEKYERHQREDPLYSLAHAFPPSRLTRKTWQHYSHDIFHRVGIDSSRNSCPASQTSPPTKSTWREQRHPLNPWYQGDQQCGCHSVYIQRDTDHTKEQINRCANRNTHVCSTHGCSDHDTHVCRYKLRTNQYSNHLDHIR